MSLPRVTSTLPTDAVPTRTSTGRQESATSATGTTEDELQTETQASSIPSTTPTTTLQTSARTSELLTATPSDDILTSFSWETLPTATPTASAATMGPDANANQPPGGMSHGCKSALIATTTTIGGTFILAFLIYALWRRRKGATYSEIIHFRPHSSTIICSPGPHNADFTALPIYRESRYSVRSSKHGSMFSFSRIAQKRAPSPSSESFAKGAWMRNHWKAAHPPTPTSTGHPLSQVMAAPDLPPLPMKPPEMAHLRAASQSQRARVDRTASESDLLKPWPAVSAREVPPSRDGRAEDAKSPPDLPKSDTELQDDSRWSWTNSQAPPTPRMRTRSPTRRSSKSSMGSLPNFRKVHSWVRNQSERASERIAEERTPRSAAKPNLPPLKNKASKPTLAPMATARPTRRLSKKSGPPVASTSRPTTASAMKTEDEGLRTMMLD